MVMVQLTNVVVTFRADEPVRRALTDTLGSSGRSVFLAGLQPDERSKELAAAEILISWNIRNELQASDFANMPNVKLLQLLSAGVDHVPFDRIPPEIIVAGNVGAYADPIAEHVVAMILAIFKNLIDRHNKLARGIFDQEFENRLLRGSICAILGFGGIGRATARLLRPFGVSIFAINTSGRTTEPVEFVGSLENIEYVLRRADIVIVTLPLTKSTHGLIGRRELGWIKNDATIVNVARGAIIDEDALFEKLQNHLSFHAAIDVWWDEPHRGERFESKHPFLTLPNFLGSPHNSGLVPNAFPTAVAFAAENVKRFINKESILGVANRSDYN